MKIILNNVHLDYDLGCRLLKTRHGDICPLDDDGLKSIWNDIKPFTFREIAELPNVEHRRLGVLYLGLDKLVKEVKPVLLNKQTLKKTTTWVNEKGETVTTSFDDTYRLFKVPGSYFSKGMDREAEDAFYIECKDTSTDRIYLLWVHPQSVYETNNPKKGDWWDVRKDVPINAIQSVAWTIQTNVKEGNIKRILRQGDCILIEPKKMGDYLERPRHITEKEYKTLLVAES